MMNLSKLEILIDAGAMLTCSKADDGFHILLSFGRENTPNFVAAGNYSTELLDLAALSNL